tara:strand:- start:6419 stop:7582 length:1164 start_codon:yes stop_codon:yes gene_type:complete
MKQNKIRILLVFGTRPEAIKMAPIFHALKKQNKKFDVKVCVTAQHRKMLDQVLDFFEINPEYDLDVMTEGQNLIDVSTNVMSKLEKVYCDFLPNVVLVHGDTCTSTAAALSAFYMNIRIGHIEAGLRTFDLKSPWPEEAQRQITAVLSDFNFAPTLLSKKNLEREGRKNIWITGNSVIDALNFTIDKIHNNNYIQKKIIQELSKQYPIKSEKRYILVTGHRRESFGDGFKNICNALKIIAEKNPTIDIVYPVHLNPNVLNPVTKILGHTKNIYLLQPLSYEVFVYLMKESFFIITDSGGIQEEAPSLKKPVLVMRNTTERPEAVKDGTAKIVGTEVNTIVESAQELITCEKTFKAIKSKQNPYGNGDTSDQIVKIISEEIQQNEKNC